MHTKKFTLIELLIVIAIAMLIFGIIVPNLTSLPAGIQKKSALATLNNTFNSARLLAVSTCSNAMVKISENGKSLIITRSNSQFSDETKFLVKSLSNYTNDNPNSTDNNPNFTPPQPIKTSLPNGCKLYVEKKEFYDPSAKDEEAFYFYAEGTGKGPRAALKIGNSFYNLNVINITGKVQIIETENQPDFITE